MLESDGVTVFKEIRPGLSNNWPVLQLLPLFWGLLAALEVHALNLGKQLPEHSHARQGWRCSTPPTTRPETTNKESFGPRKLRLRKQGSTKKSSRLPFVIWSHVILSHEINLVGWKMDGCALQNLDIFPILSSDTFQPPGYPSYFCSCTLCQWTASAEVLQRLPVRRT